MPDLERELAQYGTVLRDRVPAVRIDEVESRLHRPQASHQPVRAAVAGAVLTLASIGLVFAAGALIDVLGRVPLAEAPSVAPSAGASSGPAALALVAGGGAVAILLGAAAVGLKRRHEKQEPQRIAKTRERRKRRMQIIERPVAPVEKLARNNRFLVIGLVVAVLLAAGFGAWLLVDAIGTSTERQINNLIDDYGAAWEANDGAAVAALMTEDAVLWTGDGNRYTGDEIALIVDSANFTVERIGEPLIVEHPNFWMVVDCRQHDSGSCDVPRNRHMEDRRAGWKDADRLPGDMAVQRGQRITNGARSPGRAPRHAG